MHPGNCSEIEYGNTVDKIQDSYTGTNQRKMVIQSRHFKIIYNNQVAKQRNSLMPL